MSAKKGEGTRAIVDGNEAAASVAHRLSEVIAIYPITPSSPMGELADEWSAAGRTNIWGDVPDVVEMQSEGGAAGAVHGALQAGALTTTFTASQGLLLMIPNMYKIAGELTACCIHVAARSLATHALSIFGDHSDVMACRQTGFALLASASVQEAHDLAAIAHAATLASRVPFLHFFDGFRTSHELATIETLSDEDLRSIVDPDAVKGHHARALTPDHPVVRGTAQNPDTFFQAREACNPFHDAVPEILGDVMRRFGERTGRTYAPVEYTGHPEAERVVVSMGSGAETVAEAVDWLVARGERVGAVRVRLFRPFPVETLLAALPSTVRSIAVLDRTKEPGAVGEPLFQDVLTTLAEARATGASPLRGETTVIGGRYGLSSKEFTPAMVAAVYDELAREAPRRRFTVGITDDVTGLSLDVDDSIDIEPEEVTRALFYGLGADGTVGANKNSIKIIGEATGYEAQAYFVYDSKKSGAMTVSHLRFGPERIRAPYLVRRANFVGCHQWSFVDRYDVLADAAEGGIFLLNAPYPADEVWDRLPQEMQQTILERKLHVHVIDAYGVAERAGLGRRINTIMQTCFFALTELMPADVAIARIKETIEKTYVSKGQEIIDRNFAAVDDTLAHLAKLEIPARVTAQRRRPEIVPDHAPDFVKRVTSVMLAGEGDLLPVSAFPPDGTWPTATSRWEKRSIAREIPIWDPKVCIQCNKCALVCPHAAIRVKAYEPAALEGAPDGYRSVAYRGKELDGGIYTVQVAPDDCTGCSLCVNVCPAKDRTNPRHKAIDMMPKDPVLELERAAYAHFLDIPEMDRSTIKLDNKGSQLCQPLFEYSGACAGCGETPYIKLLTQLFGDRLLIANATGCSSIYGGNLPTTPYAVNEAGRGPAWSNSLFEDNAEFGLGFRLAVDARRSAAARLVRKLAPALGEELVEALLEADQEDEADIAAQRERVDALREKLRSVQEDAARELESLADYLVKKSVWLVGGDGWAYDIGFGGLDHVLSTDRNVNMLVLDTEVYSNTGGQQSKATPLGAAAKFAVSGKDVSKKDLGLEAMSYGHVYVASVAFGAKDQQTVRALAEAEAYPGPSLVIAYSHCIAHGYDLARGAEHQKMAVDCGMWPLYRFDPRRVEEGLPPLQLDGGRTKLRVKDYMMNEARFRVVGKRFPERFAGLVERAQAEADGRIELYRQLAEIRRSAGNGKGKGNGKEPNESATERGAEVARNGGARSSAPEES